MDLLTTASTGNYSQSICNPLAIAYPSNTEWTIYGSYESTHSIYAQPKCIPYPLFVVIRMRIGSIWIKNREHNVEFGLQILQILTKWSESIPDFKEVYSSLLFNSTITFCEDWGPGSLVCDVTKILPINSGQPGCQYAVEERYVKRRLSFKAIVYPNWAFENQLRTFVTLRNFWGIKSGVSQDCSTALPTNSRKMPPTISATSLLLRAWIHDTVNLVSIPHSKDPDTLYAFKTNHRPYRFYQELSSLLNMPFHPNVLQPPSYLVTRKTLYSVQNPSDPASVYLSEPTEPIIGFLTPFHSGGKLRDVIREKVSAGTLSSNDQAKWACQLISALLHVLKHENGTNKARCGTYTCLKMDNIVVRSPEEGSDLVLIDFEKGGNWWYYSPPENNYYYFHEPSEGPHLCGTSMLKKKNSEHVYMGSGQYFYEEPFWEHMSNQGCEKAMVFSLGCCLWCILQGYACVRGVEREGLVPPTGCSWDLAKLEKYKVPQAVRAIVTNALQRDPGSRPTLQESLDVFEAWERCMNGIEVELIGEGGSKVQATETSVLPEPVSTIEPLRPVEQKNPENPGPEGLGGTTLEAGAELGLLGSKTVASGQTVASGLFLSI